MHMRLGGGTWPKLFSEQQEQCEWPKDMTKVVCERRPPSNLSGSGTTLVCNLAKAKDEPETILELKRPFLGASCLLEGICKSMRDVLSLMFTIFGLKNKWNCFSNLRNKLPSIGGSRNMLEYVGICWNIFGNTGIPLENACDLLQSGMCQKYCSTVTILSMIM